MTIQEAIKSGKRFRHKNYGSYINPGMQNIPIEWNISLNDLLSDGWEVLEETFQVNEMEIHNMICDLINEMDKGGIVFDVISKLKAGKYK